MRNTELSTLIGPISVNRNIGMTATRAFRDRENDVSARGGESAARAATAMDAAIAAPIRRIFPPCRIGSHLPIERTIQPAAFISKPPSTMAKIRPGANSPHMAIHPDRADCGALIPPAGNNLDSEKPNREASAALAAPKPNAPARELPWRPPLPLPEPALPSG